MSGEPDTTAAKEKQEVFGMVQKALEDIMARHNTTFLNSFRQMMAGVTPRVFAQCQIVLITHLITPINHLDDHRSTLGQNPSSKPLLFP
jgi:hypothetical protein